MMDEIADYDEHSHSQKKISDLLESLLESEHVYMLTHLFVRWWPGTCSVNTHRLAIEG